MFQLLLESNAASTPRVGGSLVSTIGHVALVAAAVALTASPPERIAPPEEHPLTWVPIPPPPVLPSPPIDRVFQNTSSSPSAYGTPSLTTVIDIPIGLPAIDLNGPATQSTDFSGGPRGMPDGSGHSNAIGSGEAGTYSAEQVEKPVVLRPGARVPVYPDVLRSMGLSGTVVVEFVVDTLGRVEPTSLQTLQADHDLFSVAVGRVVPTLRFIPAEVSGRKVRQRVRLPFRFDLHS
ncbi:MAG: energy transducer TonB [Gemmatimonadaceae bacterium]|nr:energy transducer TonB [Gemmatimonadaceae bacterium]